MRAARKATRQAPWIVFSSFPLLPLPCSRFLALSWRQLVPESARVVDHGCGIASAIASHDRGRLLTVLEDVYFSQPEASAPSRPVLVRAPSGMELGPPETSPHSSVTFCSFGPRGGPWSVGPVKGGGLSLRAQGTGVRGGFQGRLFGNRTSQIVFPSWRQSQAVSQAVTGNTRPRFFFVFAVSQRPVEPFGDESPVGEEVVNDGEH